MEGIFKNAEFYTEINTKRFGFESDVYAEKSGIKLIVQCKQHDNSYLNVIEKLFEWEAKGRYAKVNKVILVVSGREIREDEYEKAKELGVCLWNEDLIQELLKLNKEDLKKELNRLIEFKEEEYKQKEEKEETKEETKEEEKEKTEEEKERIELEEIRKEIFEERRIRQEKKKNGISEFIRVVIWLICILVFLYVGYLLFF
ncbi:unnamed protein product [marine sediment metagenome]|uniref:Uncharacterized protein n=1 Tax=marine sediment metagenome TaxID=412755 RepID=X1LWS6_9ZZZZ